MPQNTWHVSRGGQTYGPYTWEEIVEHTRGGRIGRSDKLFDPRSGAWAKPSKVPGLLGPGGVATIPAGLAAVAMTSAVILALLAVLAAWALTPENAPDGMGLSDVVPTIEISAVTISTAPPASTGPTVLMAPEGLTFKGNYRSEWKERDAPGGTLLSDGPCYLWIFTTESGTVATFDFQETIGAPTWDGRNWLPLVSHTGSHYVFQSSGLTRVDEWKLVVDITDTGMSGTVMNITPEIGTFVRGTFSGQSISYEQYQAEAPS